MAASPRSDAAVPSSDRLEIYSRFYEAARSPDITLEQLGNVQQKLLHTGAVVGPGPTPENEIDFFWAEQTDSPDEPTPLVRYFRTLAVTAAAMTQQAADGTPEETEHVLREMHATFGALLTNARQASSGVTSAFIQLYATPRHAAIPTKVARRSIADQKARNRQLSYRNLAIGRNHGAIATLPFYRQLVQLPKHSDSETPIATHPNLHQAVRLLVAGHNLGIFTAATTLRLSLAIRDGIDSEDPRITLALADGTPGQPRSKMAQQVVDRYEEAVQLYRKFEQDYFYDDHSWQARLSARRGFYTLPFNRIMKESAIFMGTMYTSVAALSEMGVDRISNLNASLVLSAMVAGLRRNRSQRNLRPAEPQIRPDGPGSVA